MKLLSYTPHHQLTPPPKTSGEGFGSGDIGTEADAGADSPDHEEHAAEAAQDIRDAVRQLLQGSVGETGERDTGLRVHHQTARVRDCYQVSTH